LEESYAQKKETGSGYGSTITANFGAEDGFPCLKITFKFTS